MEMVKAIGLKKYYVTDSYEVHALDGVTFSVEDGEFLAIVGTSGSGKTTLLNLLGGLDVPTEGGVWIRGKSLKDMVAEERTIFRRRNIGFVFQQYNLVPMLSVYENIVLPRGWMEQGSTRNSLRKSRCCWEFRINWSGCPERFPEDSSREWRSPGH